MPVKERKRIHWTNEQKQQILDEAAHLHLQHPHDSRVWLIREAQKVLPVEDQRNLTTIGWGSAFTWFTEGFDDAVLRAQQKLDRTEDVVPVQPPEVTPPSMLEILSTMVKAMEELKGTLPQKQELPIGIVGRLDQLQEKLDRLETRVSGFFESGFMLVPTGITLRPAMAPVSPAPITAEGTGFTTPRVLADSKPVSPPPPLPPSPPTRKPRVVVLNTDSGHVRHGIQRGTQGHVSQLTFSEVSELKTPEFKEFDYIMAYKKTPITWVQAAKQFYPIKRFYAVSGGAESMAEAIKKLPPIEVGK